MDNRDIKIDKLEKQITDERARLSSDRMDISFGEIINMYRNDELIIRPEYQRLFRWSTKQKTALIESVLLGIPIPPIFVAEDEDGVWELVDGLQRVSTIISFFGELKQDVSRMETVISDNTVCNEIDEEMDGYTNSLILNNWELESGSLLEDLEGFNINTLPKKYVINIKRAVCRVEILRGESNTSMKYELFKRLNSGGSKLTPQEIRNAIYRGIDPVINELILELSQNSIFKKLTVLSTQKMQELYDQELVLRFIAFLDNIDNINSNTETFLDKFMEKSLQDNSFNVNYFRDSFVKVFELLDRLDDISVFRNGRNAFVPAFFEGITIGIAQNYDLYKANINLLKEKIDFLKGDEKFSNYSGTASNSKSRIKKRLKRANVIFSTVGEVE